MLPKPLLPRLHRTRDVRRVFHNFIIDVKGRMDDRDKTKARRGRRDCELFTEYDKDPWHYLSLIENASDGREDITWWEGRSAPAILHVLKRHEGLPLVPKGGSRSQPSGPVFEIDAFVTEDEKYKTGLPVSKLVAVVDADERHQLPSPKA